MGSEPTANLQSRLGAIASAVKPVCERHPLLRRLYLFGSRARGSERPGSDYDFYAELDHSACEQALPQYLSIIDGLESALSSRIDFVSGEAWNARDALLKEEIERDKVLLYDRDA